MGAEAENSGALSLVRSLEALTISRWIWEGAYRGMRTQSRRHRLLLEHPTLEDPSEALKLQAKAALGAAAAATATAASAVANAAVAAVAEIAAAVHGAVAAVVEEVEPKRSSSN